MKAGLLGEARRRIRAHKPRGPRELWLIFRHPVARRIRKIRAIPGRSWRRAKAQAQALRLALRNLRCTETVLSQDDAAPVVSLTSYGRRADQCHLAIESIAAGHLRPSRLLLWLDDPRLIASPTPGLQRLVSRGLEIRSCPDDGPHKKYLGAVADPEICSGRDLVTADDDTIYPPWWLSRLVEAARFADRATVTCHRAVVIELDEDGSPLPYRSWRRCLSTEPSFRVFPTGVGGVLYPPEVHAALRDAGDRWREAAPRADDVWLHFIAVSHEVPSRQVGPAPANFLDLPGTQANALTLDNLVFGRNDLQVGETYTREALEVLGRAGPPSVADERH